jgi:hypothetical protein
MIWPVVWEDLGESKNTTIEAISSVVVILRSRGIFDLISFSF